MSKEVFEKLKAALDEFGLRSKIASPKPKAPLRQKLSKEEPLGCPTNGDLRTNRDKCAGSFEPSNIIESFVLSVTELI